MPFAFWFYMEMNEAHYGLAHCSFLPSLFLGAWTRRGQSAHIETIFIRRRDSLQGNNIFYGIIKILWSNKKTEMMFFEEAKEEETPLCHFKLSGMPIFFLRHLVHFSIGEVRVLQWQMFITHSHPKSTVGGLQLLFTVLNMGLRPKEQPLAVGLVETYITFSK